MATLPQPAPAAGAMPPGGDPAAAQPEPQGYTICIEVGGDGRLSVGVDKGMESSEGEDGGAMPPTSPGDLQDGAPATGPVYQPVGDIKEALTMALDIYRSNGDAAASGQADQEFDAAYQGKSMKGMQ